MVGYWKPVYLKENDTIEMSGTEPYELPETGDISMLELVVQVTNGAAANLKNNPEYSMSKIEVLHHGNHVMKSFDARIALFSAAKDMPGVPESQVYDSLADRYQINRIPILFGRKPFDKEYFARLEDLGDCSLRLTRDFTTGCEYRAGTAYLATAKVTVDLIAWKWFGEALPAPKGFFKNSLVKEWNPTANSESEDFKPSTGNKWRHIIMQFEAAAWWMEQKIAEVQFDENNESPIFYKRITEDLERENMLVDNLLFRTVHTHAVDGMTILTQIAGPKEPTEGGHIIGTPVSAPTTKYAYFVGGSGNALTVYTDKNSHWQITGTDYQECLLLNLERMFGGELYESAGKSMPRLKLTAAAAGISTILPRVRVHLEELITPPYGV